MFKCLASFLVLSTGVCLGQSFVGADTPSGPTTEPKKPIIFDVSAIDKTADPCVDFYQFACGNWLKKNPVPSDQARWSTVQRAGGEKQLSAVRGAEGCGGRSEVAFAEEVWRLLCGVHERGPGEQAGREAA